MEVFLMYLPLGMLAGFTGGLFGVGGGVVVVPVLLLIFAALAMPEEILTHMALATSLAAMVVTSISSAIAHIKANAVRFDVFRWLVIGVLAGSWLGVATAISLSGTVLQAAFGFFLLYVGIQMFVGFGIRAEGQSIQPLVLSLAGGVIGGVSMLFGIGGGSMTVPLLSWRGLPSQQAVATSALLGVPIALSGAVLYAINQPQVVQAPQYSLGYIYLPALLGLVLTSIPSARLGAQLAHRLPEKKLRKSFGVFVIFMAVSLLSRSLLQ